MLMVTDHDMGRMAMTSDRLRREALIKRVQTVIDFYDPFSLRELGVPRKSSNRRPVESSMAVAATRRAVSIWCGVIHNLKPDDQNATRRREDSKVWRIFSSLRVFVVALLNRFYWGFFRPASDLK